LKDTLKIDEIDIKILRGIIKNARIKLKDLAEDCDVSINAIFKRIHRLKDAGLIKRATLFTNMPAFGYEISATIGISLRPDQELDVINLIRNKKMNEAAISRSMGKCDLCIFLMTKNLREMENLKQSLILQGINRISVNFWVKPSFHFENVDLESTER
jgi:DNA-binding Lrp family transcriptional regulator